MMQIAVRHVFHEEVFNCQEAAAARDINIKRELKTILLNAGAKKIAIHLRGCDDVNFRKIKGVFKIKDITFISPEELLRYRLSKGTINPWNIEFCHYHLVCIKIFHNKFLTTNNSNTRQGIFFLSKHIIKLPNLILGHFSHEKTG